MAIDLIKRGQTVDITKNRSGLNKLTVGLSWKTGGATGILGALFGGGGGAVDVDSAVLAVDMNGRKQDLVYFGNKRSNGIIHAGDDRTGNQKFGEVDNEEIAIDLSRIHPNVQKLVFIVNIYSGSSNFGAIKESYIRLLNSDNKEELIRYNLTEDYKGKKGIVVGEL